MAIICATVAADTAAEAVKAASGLKCDLVEVRLDLMKSLQNLNILSKIRQRLLVTCMPSWEGGGYKGSEGDRIHILISCLGFADYVSLEYRTEGVLRRRLASAARRRRVKVILSYHDFHSTPSKGRVIGIMRRLDAAGADVVKVAFKPKSIEDVVNVLSAQVESGLKTPLVAISMGSLGRITRVVGPALGGYMSFAAPTASMKSALGQFTVDEMITLRRILS